MRSCGMEAVCQLFDETSRVSHICKSLILPVTSCHEETCYVLDTIGESLMMKV